MTAAHRYAMTETYREWIYRIRSQERKMKSGRGGILSEKDYKALQEMRDVLNGSEPIYPAKYIYVRR